MVTAALVNSSWKLDAEVPSPGQFDHNWLLAAGQKRVVWLDTTPEVPPFGYLVLRLRDKGALVMSARFATYAGRSPGPAGLIGRENSISSRPMSLQKTFGTSSRRNL
jgi:hypothetical protein